MATYSLTATGVIAGPVLTNKNYDIPDLSSSGIVTGKGDARKSAMRIGDQMLVLCPDGTSRWMTLDAERSTNDNPILVPVGP